MIKMPIKIFVEQLQEAVSRKDGYIMGATGQDPKKWAENSWWFTQYNESTTQKKKALYWRENATRVWDCNGLAEGMYKDYTGTDINTKARYNYSGWCSIKGAGLIPVNKRVPGAAVFWGNTASSITHIAYLEKPVVENKPEGDWYIIEARGVTYGVVRTKLYSRDPDFWGIMDKYFDYENINANEAAVYVLGERVLKKEMKGADISELQTLLTNFGYLNDEIDGIFGSKTEEAVKNFQMENGLTVDGEYGKQSHNVMLSFIEQEQEQLPVNTIQILVAGDSVNIRYGDTTDYDKIGLAKKGEKLNPVLDEEGKAIVSSNGWYAIYYNNFIGWISGKYASLTA